MLDDLRHHAKQQGWDEQVRRLAARSLRILLARLGADAPIHEADIRSLPADRPGTSTRRILQFLTRRGLVVPDPARQIDNHQRAIDQRIQTLPENIADELRNWVLVLRGEGRRELFRSLVIPLKAVALNILTTGASYGILVAVFQWGWGDNLLGLSEPMVLVPRR
ncbi:hypothetical protein [Streptomyces sp. NPDC006285]|uniref:hypothetical protein n=1 Tax=Streptomyces sp. NPDC006285 TaxID=3364742 RepID=UPI0036C39289